MPLGQAVCTFNRAGSHSGEVPHRGHVVLICRDGGGYYVTTSPGIQDQDGPVGHGKRRGLGSLLQGSISWGLCGFSWLGAGSAP